jgi:hypothetical protein
MAFRRPSALSERLSEGALTRDMAGLGMNFAVEPNAEAPIEETLVQAIVDLASAPRARSSGS